MPIRRLIRLTKDHALQADHVTAIEQDQQLRDTCFVHALGRPSHFSVPLSLDALLTRLHAPENDVIDAARALLQVLDIAAGPLQTMAETCRALGKPYTGPNFADQMEDLRIALEQAE